MTEPHVPQPPDEEAPSPESTVKLKAGAPEDPRRTLKIDLPPPPVLAVSGSTQKLDLRPERKAAHGYAWKVPVAVAALAVLGLGGYFAFFRGTPPAAPGAPSPGTPAEILPPGVQPYLDQARAGDPDAMRMLGVMYYYGLNVPQDRDKGLYWYRQAAAKGSAAARDELAKLQGDAVPK